MPFNVCLLFFKLHFLSEKCAVLGYYAASRGNSLSTFRDNLAVPYSRAKNKKKGFKTLEVGTDMSFQNVGK